MIWLLYPPFYESNRETRVLFPGCLKRGLRRLRLLRPPSSAWPSSGHVAIHHYHTNATFTSFAAAALKNTTCQPCFALQDHLPECFCLTRGSAHSLHFYFLLQEECYEALESISRKINTNDADMRSHVILSMIKVAAAEADVPALPPSAGGRSTGCHLLLVFNVLLVIQSHWLFRTIWWHCCDMQCYQCQSYLLSLVEEFGLFLGPLLTPL